jgi:seryl-tRNA synthetase
MDGQGMEIQNWIMAQMVIDLIIACVLLWFIRVTMKGKKPDNDLDETFRKSEGILAEIRELSLSLDKNLEEKRKLSRTILDQLDETLYRAEEACERVRDISKDIVANPERSKNIPNNSDQIRSSVKALIAKGLPREEIAQHLGMSVDEIDLLIKLQSRSGKGKQKYDPL